MNYFKNPMGPVEKAMRDYGVDITGIDFPGGVEEMNMDYFKNPMGLVEKAMRNYGVYIMNVHDVVMGLCTSTFGASTRALGSSSQTLRVAGLAAYPHGAVDQP